MNIYFLWIHIISNYILFLTARLVIINKPSKNKIQYQVCCWQSLFYIATISQFWLPTPANAHFLVIITVATISPESDPVTINVCSNIHVFNATAIFQFHLNILWALFKDKQMHIVSKLCQNFCKILINSISRDKTFGSQIILNNHKTCKIVLFTRNINVDVIS